MAVEDDEPEYWKGDGALHTIPWTDKIDGFEALCVKVGWLIV